MNKTIFFIIPLVVVLLSSFNTGFSTSSNLTLEVTNIKNVSGKSVYVGIFVKNGFLLESKVKYKKMLIGNGSKASINFDLPNGDYAIALFHDTNGNKKIDKNFFGIPKEPYGFSNNFKPLFSAPDFSDCSFNLNGTAKKISIALLH